MYSIEERQKAVDLFLTTMSEQVVWQTLGYPSPNALRAWVREYLEHGKLHEKVRFKPRYSKEQIDTAVAYYVEHQCGLTETCRILGYPNRMTLRGWIIDICPEKLHRPAKQYCKCRQKLIRYSTADKIAIVNEHIDSRVPLYQLAAKYHVSKAAISKWKKQYIDGDVSLQMKTEDKILSNESKIGINDSEEISSLKAQIHQLRMERDALLVAAEIIKKDKGVSLENLRNAEKADVIDALRDVYQLSELLKLLKIAKSSYFYSVKCRMVDKYQGIRGLIVQCFSESNNSYGYRRIAACIRRAGLIVSEKVIRRIMREEGVIVSQPSRRKYSSYQGEISPAADNIIKRNFHANQPNQKWLTDITEFSIPAGKVYLSPIIDCFDGMAVSWTIGTSPNANLANSMLDKAILTLQHGERPIVHSDRGSHYRWPGWIDRMNTAGLIRSMSKKGCSPDNSACEGFFGRLKNEMFYNRLWGGVTIEQFIAQLDRYIHWYNEKRIKMSLGGLSPVEYRQSLGLI